MIRSNKIVLKRLNSILSRHKTITDTDLDNDSNAEDTEKKRQDLENHVLRMNSVQQMEVDKPSECGRITGKQRYQLSRKPCFGEEKPNDIKLPCSRGEINSRETARKTNNIFLEEFRRDEVPPRIRSCKKNLMGEWGNCE